MKVELSLYREEGERALPSDLAVPVPKPMGRPRTEYRLRVRSEADVDRLRRHGVPLALLTPEALDQYGFSLSFRPRLLVPSSLRAVVDTRFPVLELRDEATTELTLEDLVVVMLKFRRLAARQLVRRNRTRLDRRRLTRRLVREDALDAASRVRLGDFVRGLPRTAEPLSRSDLAAEDAVVYGAA
jgi:hypothetical protein